MNLRLFPTFKQVALKKKDTFLEFTELKQKLKQTVEMITLRFVLLSVCKSDAIELK